MTVLHLNSGIGEVVGARKLDPAGLRETEFIWGGSRRRKPTGLAPFATVFRGPIKKVRKRGPRPGFEIAMGLAAGRSIKPLRGRSVVSQPSHRRRKRQSSSGVRALESRWFFL